MPAPGMKCFFETCRRPITGTDVGKRIEVRRVGAEPVAYGSGMAAGPLEAGEEYALVHTFHRQCWYIFSKRPALLAARDADPSANKDGAPDWRHQDLADVEELRGLGGAAGGAGSAPG